MNCHPERSEGSAVCCEMQTPASLRTDLLARRLFQVDRFFQRQTLRGTAHQKCIVARNQLPGVSLNVEDGEIQRLQFDLYLFTLSRIEFDFAPAYQPLWRLPGAFRQRSVDLGNLRSSPIACVRHLETHLNTFSRSNFEIGITVSGIRETVAEGK